MLANRVDLDVRSGMGAGPMCPAHVNSHGRRGERWKRAECESIHVVNTCIDSVGVNELAFSWVRGVNIGVAVGGKLLYVLRLCVGGHIQALILTHNPYPKAY